MSSPSPSNGRPLQVGDVVNHDLRPLTTHPLIARNQIQALTAMEHVSRVTPEQRREMREKQQRLIEGGYVDLGPVADHSIPATDIRDMRDSTDLGTQIINTKRLRGDCTTASAAQDMLTKIGSQVRLFTDGGVDHAELRKQELEHRAASGDKFAAALLRGETLAEEPVD